MIVELSFTNSASPPGHADRLRGRNDVPQEPRRRPGLGDADMTYFSHIDPTNKRRFFGPEGQVLAIYDQCRSYTLYAPVGATDDGVVCFAGEPRSYFSDEVEEIS
jgi:hypothetical protein